MVDRRSFLRLSVAAGTAGVLSGGASALASVPAAAAPAQAPSVSSEGRGPLRLFDAADMNFQALFALGETAYGAGEVGEVLFAVDQANAAGATHQSFCDAFAAMATQVGGYADGLTAKGARVPARAAHLRAAQYWNQVLYFVLATSRPGDEAAVYQRMNRHWVAAVSAMDPPPQRIAIPYGRTTLPGWFFRPDARPVRRPTVIVNNGSDAQNIDVWGYGVAAALERGWNAVVFEGPGQGSTLFERRIPFRPDWEAVIRPLVTLLQARSDVDPRRIALTGWSMGGLLVLRAAAYEPRLAAVVSDPGTVDVGAAWPQDLRELGQLPQAECNAIWQHDIVPNMAPPERFTVMKRGEIFGRSFQADALAGRVPQDVWSLINTIERFRLDRSTLQKVRCRTLVVNYQREQFLPGQARTAYDGLAAPKSFVTMRASEGAAYHCAPMAPQRRNDVVMDWLARAVG